MTRLLEPLAALLALVAPFHRVNAALHPSHLLLLAPANLHASLTVSHDDSNLQWAASTSHGDFLLVQTTSTTVSIPTVDLANLSSIHATWTPALTPASSTFERLFGAASPFSLPFLFSAGNQVRVVTKTNGLTEANSLFRAFLQAAPEPLQRLIPGFREQDGHSIVAHPPVPDLIAFHTPLADTSPLLTALVLRPSTTDKATLTLDVITASVTSRSVLDSSAFSTVDGSSHRLLVVHRVDNEKSLATVASVADGLESPQRIPLVDATTVGEIALTVLGEGFHRRVRVDLTTATPCQASGTTNAKVLLVVPLSTSVYADLDELRRMERFGELTLHAPTKHIEIERPTAVSSQHVIALEFPIDTTAHTHTLEFPIHLRYQSPSNASFYASAFLLAPDVFVSCASTMDSQPSNYDGPLDTLFSQWVTDAAWEAMNWRRVIPSSPLADVHVPVPVGFIPHGPLVSAVTFSVTGLGALVLVYVAWKTSSNTAEAARTSLWKPKTT